MTYDASSLARNAATTVADPAFWAFLKRLATGERLLVTSDHGYAHIGGFLSGLALGVPLVPRMTSGRTRYLERQKLAFAAAAFLLILFAYFIAKLR